MSIDGIFYVSCNLVRCGGLRGRYVVAERRGRCDSNCNG